MGAWGGLYWDPLPPNCPELQQQNTEVLELKKKKKYSFVGVNPSGLKIYPVFSGFVVRETEQLTLLFFSLSNYFCIFTTQYLPDLQ